MSRVMVEVFKTNVKDSDHASMLLEQIHKNFLEYKANFDLEDCDNILRVRSVTGSIQSSLLINLLKDFGFNAEVLPDAPQTEDPGSLTGETFSMKNRPTSLIRQ